MSPYVLIEAVKADGFSRGGVVASAFGDVQAAGVFDGRNDDGADGGQVDGPAAGAAGRGIFAETEVADVMVGLGARYRPPSGSNGARSRARSVWLARLIHCPTAVNRSFPAAVNAQTAIATRQGQRIDPPPR
jgi:hypothetical protein